MTITQEQWDTATAHVREIQSFAQRLGPAGDFYFSTCEVLLRLYESGDRSGSLYEEMIGLN